MNLFKSAFTASEAVPYTVEQTLEKGVEERLYPSLKWIVTETVSDNKSMDNTKGDRFWTLYGYINGKNDKAQQIAMTVPVVTKVEPDSESKDKTNYQMSFYIPSQFQEDPPVPSDPAVKILERGLRVYTITFPGFAKEGDYDKKLEELVEILKSLGINLPADPPPTHFYVGYDSPAKLLNRKNEVWVTAAVAAE